jgi:predicted RNA binding protein YcfA (HicA-like mRNA interferase family)
MTVREVLRLLHRDGWHVVRQEGSHRILRHGRKKGIVVLAGNPSKDVPRALLHTILKQAGLMDQ